MHWGDKLATMLQAACITAVDCKQAEQFFSKYQPVADEVAEK